MKNQSQIEANKSRNNIGFAYSDAEINAVNLARNNKERYRYFKNASNEETGILIDENDQPVRNADGGIVIELPACAVYQDSPIDPRLQEQLKHLEKFKKTHSDKKIYPIKILFPYKLREWHWNVGEIIVSNKNGNLTISGCAYDSYGSVGPLEKKIQEEIQKTFTASGYKTPQTTFAFNKKEESIKKVQTGVACGLYASIAMHNLKTKKVKNIWDGIFNGNSKNRKTEQELRNIDSDLIKEHNHHAIENFCKPDANIPPTYKEAAIKQNATLGEAIKSLSSIDDTNKNNLITHLNTFNSSKKELIEKLNELFTNLEGNEAKNLIFTLNEKDEREELKITTEILALLPKELKFSISSDNKNSTNTENENIFSACIQLIDDSFRLEVYKIAQNSIQKIESNFLDKKEPTPDEQSIKCYYESILSVIDKIKEEEDKTILTNFLNLTLNEIIEQVNEKKELKEKSNQQKPQSNNQIIIKSDNRLIDYRGFEVVICDKKSTTIARQKAKIFDSVIPDIKEDINYAFCKQNNQIKALTTTKGNTKPASHNFGFRFNSEAGELINAVNKEGASDEAKNKAWKKLLTEHDTVIFKLASDGKNYIRFYLNRDKDGKIEFAFDECLFSKVDALDLSKDFTKYDEIKEKSKKAIDKNERFDIHLYCKSGEKETDKDKEILNYPFNSNEQTQHIITDMNIEKNPQKSQTI